MKYDEHKDEIVFLKFINILNKKFTIFRIPYKFKEHNFGKDEN